ncbi:hypothetical protein BSKO_12949 [Bryopsis sp. KO-2023]|nr:hypothetical protein BSKO_12949 [Bryopsis sp. KO-2023]
MDYLGELLTFTDGALALVARDWKMAVASGVLIAVVETTWKYWKEKKELPVEEGPVEEGQVEEEEKEVVFYDAPLAAPKKPKQKPPTIGKKRTRGWIIERDDHKKAAVESKGSETDLESDEMIKQNNPKDEWPSGDENTSSPAENFIFSGGKDENDSVAGKVIFGFKSDVSSKGKEGLELALAPQDQNEDEDDDDWDGSSVESGLGDIDDGPMPWDEVPLKDVGYLDMEQVLTDVLKDLDGIHSSGFVHTSVKVENIKRRWKRGAWNFFLGGEIRANGSEEEDIFCLAKVFVKICEGQSPPSHVEEVVSKMMQEDESQRPTAYDAFETIAKG